MGLLDFFRKKPESEPEPERDEPSADYLYAHYALRGLFLGDPLHILAILGTPRAREFLQFVLDDVRKVCGRTTSFKVDEILVHPTRLGEFPCMVLQFPEPTEMPNAMMVALVVEIDLSQTKVLPDQPVPARYITLEKTFRSNGEPGTVLAEWAKENKHLHYGPGPVAQLDAFCQAVCDLLTRGKAIHGSADPGT